MTIYLCPRCGKRTSQRLAEVYNAGLCGPCSNREDLARMKRAFDRDYIKNAQSLGREPDPRIVERLHETERWLDSLLPERVA